jgi:hypothetical protein
LVHRAAPRNAALSFLPLFCFSPNARRRSPILPERPLSTLSSAADEGRVTVEEYRSIVVLWSPSASSSNDAILPIRCSAAIAIHVIATLHSDHGAFANTSENQLERVLSCGADAPELC